MKSKIFFINQGFTLIELMIVVAIIGIISAIAIPSYNGYITSGRITQCANEVATIRLAQKQYFLENNRYFPNPDGTADTSKDDTDYKNLEKESGGYFRSTYREYKKIDDDDASYEAHVNCDYKLTTSDSGLVYKIEVTGIRSLKDKDDEVSGLNVNIDDSNEDET